jgi:hypothetical protein
MKGFILLNRSVINHPLVGVRNPAYFVAWCWMLFQARFADGFITINTHKISIKRGQFSHSVSYISKAVGMTQWQVRSFIEKLENHQMVETENHKGQNIISICNYDQYQDFIQSAHKGGEPKTTKGSEPIIRDLFAPINFDEFWKIYPKKEKKREAEIAYNNAVLGSTSEEAILKGAKDYAKAKEGVDKQYLALPSTWLNQGRWTDVHKVADQPDSKEEIWKFRIDQWKAGKWDEDRWGFPPNHPQNQVPKRILNKFLT